MWLNVGDDRARGAARHAIAANGALGRLDGIRTRSSRAVAGRVAALACSVSRCRERAARQKRMC